MKHSVSVFLGDTWRTRQPGQADKDGICVFDVVIGMYWIVMKTGKRSLLLHIYSELHSIMLSFTYQIVRHIIFTSCRSFNDSFLCLQFYTMLWFLYPLGQVHVWVHDCLLSARQVNIFASIKYPQTLGNHSRAPPPSHEHAWHGWVVPNVGIRSMPFNDDRGKEGGTGCGRKPRCIRHNPLPFSSDDPFSPAAAGHVLGVVGLRLVRARQNTSNDFGLIQNNVVRDSWNILPNPEHEKFIFGQMIFLLQLILYNILNNNHDNHNLGKDVFKLAILRPTTQSWKYNWNRSLTSSRSVIDSIIVPSMDASV